MTRTSARLTARATAGTVAALLLLGLARQAAAVSLDADNKMRLGLRVYTAVRIGTEAIGEQNETAFPPSPAGHLRQHRSFIQLELTHDVLKYATSGWGPVRLFDLIDPDVLSYTLQYRGEFEGIYDYGPDEYENYEHELRQFRRDVPPGLGFLGLTRKLEERFIQERVRRLSRIGRDRHRLFLAYLDFEKGPLYLRVGRQILAWGETDIFRLLDNINPLDDSFGGFFIQLDERRVPLDMIRASWGFGSFSKFSDVFLEGFVATGKRVAQDPGVPEGSPWMPGGLALPNPSLSRTIDLPKDTDVRGGVRLSFNFSDITFTLAHYYTYLDVPGIVFTLPGCKPRPAGGAPCGLGGNTASFKNPIIAEQQFPRVAISGLSLTFPVPSWYSIVRSEFAYFQDEPMNRQGEGNARLTVQPLGSTGAKKLRQNLEGGLDPFVYPAFLDLGRLKPVHGTLLQRDTLNIAVGVDVNRYLRFLNRHQSFFISTQLFYKHVFDSPGDLVLPVLHRNIGVPGNAPIVGKELGGCPKAHGSGTRNCRLRPRLFHLDDDRFLHTLLITTTYAGGRIIPSFGAFYDWQGAWVFQPGVTFVRDPFRFIVDYTAVSAAPTGQFGAVRNRDNVRFQVEFVF
jgi:hypothetical protein